jgi:predicted metal-dependent peptidase
MTRKTPKQIIREHIGLMVIKYPALALPLLKCQLVVEDIKPGFVAAIDPVHKKLYVSPSLAEHKSETICFVLAHEALHVITGTHGRRGNRDPFLWNIATDLEVNWVLIDDMKLKPANFTGYVNEQTDLSPLYNAKYKHVYAEKIYEEIQKFTKQISPRVTIDAQGNVMIDLGLPDGSGQESGQEGEEKDQQPIPGTVHVDSDGTITVIGKDGEIIARGKISDIYKQPDSNEESRKLKQEEREAAVNVSQMAKKGIGKIPAGLQRLVDRLVDSKVSWKDLLEDAITTVMERNDYSYRRPNKLYMMDDFYVPTLLGEERNIVVVVDTSGSIGEEELRTFLSEVKALIEMYKVTYIACDCSVYSVVEDVQDMQEVFENTHGGGGTSFAPAFEKISELDKDKIIVILMTDGYNGEPEMVYKPDNVDKVIALTTTDKAPEDIEYDILIKINDEE